LEARYDIDDIGATMEETRTMIVKTNGGREAMV